MCSIQRALPEGGHGARKRKIEVVGVRTSELLYLLETFYSSTFDTVFRRCGHVSVI